MDAIQESVMMDNGEFIDPDELAELLSGAHGMTALMAAREVMRLRVALDGCRMTMADMAASLEFARSECQRWCSLAERYAVSIEEMSIKLAG